MYPCFITSLRNESMIAELLPFVGEQIWTRSAIALSRSMRVASGGRVHPDRPQLEPPLKPLHVLTQRVP